MTQVHFSQSAQSFYDLSMGYPNLPDDLIEVSKEVHHQMLAKMNLGHFAFSDGTYSDAARKSPAETYSIEKRRWIDERTAEEKRATYELTLKPLSRRQFRLMLVRHGFKLAEIRALIENSIEDEIEREEALIEWDDAPTFERFSPTLLMMGKALGLEYYRMNEMWEFGMTR